jgi:hypothetical protein
MAALYPKGAKRVAAKVRQSMMHFDKAKIKLL